MCKHRRPQNQHTHHVRVICTYSYVRRREDDVNKVRARGLRECAKNRRNNNNRTKCSVNFLYIYIVLSRHSRVSTASCWPRAVRKSLKSICAAPPPPRSVWLDNKMSFSRQSPHSHKFQARRKVLEQYY